jgi:hypothetical protein
MPRKHKKLPWYNEELKIMQRNCSYLFKLTTDVKKQLSTLDENSQNPNFIADLLFKQENAITEFKESRLEYNRALRRAEINYFANKTASFFESSKLFWDFYTRTTINTRSTKSDEQIESIVIEDELKTDKREKVNIFNKDFTSNKPSNKVDDMKTMPEIQNKVLNFEFRHVSPVEVEKKVTYNQKPLFSWCFMYSNKAA